MLRRHGLTGSAGPLVRHRRNPRFVPRAPVGIRLLCRHDPLSGNSRGRMGGAAVFRRAFGVPAFLSLQSSCVSGAVPRRSERCASSSALLMVLGAGLSPQGCVYSSPRRPRRRSVTVSGRVRD